MPSRRRSRPSGTCSRELSLTTRSLAAVGALAIFAGLATLTVLLARRAPDATDPVVAARGEDQTAPTVVGADTAGSPERSPVARALEPQPSPERPSPASPLATSGIEGHVVDDAGYPVAGIEVHAVPQSMGEPDEARAFTRRALTDEAGAYRIAPLDAGSWSVRLAGLERVLEPGVDVPSAGPHTLAAGERATINLVAPRTTRVEVLVFEGERPARAGARVRLSRETTLLQAFTDAGVAVLPQVRPGEYRLAIDRDGRPLRATETVQITWSSDPLRLERRLPLGGD